MYARPAGKSGQPIEFGVSGRLWRDSLIMFDRQTKSLWSQVLGRSVQGEMEGTELEHVPATRATWSEWRRLHPDTLALAKPAEVTESPYERYFADPEKMGISGEELSDRRLPGKSTVYGLEPSSGGSPVAVPLAEGRRGLVWAELDGQPVVVARDGLKAAAWELEDRRLRWRWNRGRPFLAEEGGPGRWDPWTGESLRPGVRLRPVEGVVTYWFTWAGFHPDTGIAGDRRAAAAPR